MADPLLLVGDNPFLGVSHLSQERAQSRGADVRNPEHAAELLATALEHGANGFLFSVSETSLAILKALGGRTTVLSPRLYAIAPFTFEYVRAAVRLGGLPGVAKQIGGRVARSRNVYAVAEGLRGAVRNDPGALFRAYMSYEVSRIRSAAGPDDGLVSVLLHEVVGDMALGLGMDWMFRAHIEANRRAGTRPGFNTRNLPYLIQRFKEWGIGLDGTVIAAPFNAEGFQMTPSKEECEAALVALENSEVIAFSVLAAGHLGYSEALEYVTGLPNLRGVAIGVSKPEQARSTFRDLRESFSYAG